MLDLPNIKIIGLTGMSGAGKSTVCKVFSQKDFIIIDCDDIARQTAKNRGFLNELQSRFPEDLLNPDGSLDREVTAKSIFSDPEKRKLYNKIIFPYIIYDVFRKIEYAGRSVLLDAPTLFEARLDMVCSKIVSVTATADNCLSRIIKRDNITPEQARRRLLSQHGAEYFKEHSDYYIENNGTAQQLIDRAERLIDNLSA